MTTLTNRFQLPNLASSSAHNLPIPNTAGTDEFCGGPTAGQSSHVLIARHADIGRVARWKQKDLLARRNGPHATVYMTNGDWYLGDWSGDLKHGNGTYYYHKTGSIYEGEWSADVRCGYGTYAIPINPQPKSK
ncbi:hypothetical protein HK097_006902, partial [Rhizophlyctis rosea]